MFALLEAALKLLNPATAEPEETENRDFSFDSLFALV